MILVLQDDINWHLLGIFQHGDAGCNTIDDSVNECSDQVSYHVAVRGRVLAEFLLTDWGCKGPLNAWVAHI